MFCTDNTVFNIIQFIHDYINNNDVDVENGFRIKQDGEKSEMTIRKSMYNTKACLINITCDNIKSIPVFKDYDQYEYLDIYIDNCPKLTRIENLSAARYINIRNCPNLETIIRIAYVSNLIVYNCPILKTIKYLCSIGTAHIEVYACKIQCLDKYYPSHIKVKNITEWIYLNLESNIPAKLDRLLSRNNNEYLDYNISMQKLNHNTNNECIKTNAMKMYLMQELNRNTNALMQELNRATNALMQELNLNNELLFG